MTQAFDFNPAALEPGCDDNPLDQPQVYNPFYYAYEIMVSSAVGQLAVAVELALAEAGEFETVEFDWQDKHFSVPLFPQIQDGLLPMETRDIRFSTYQVGESPYFIVPQVVRVRADEELLSREQAQQLITPQALFNGLFAYYNKVSNDPRAPQALKYVLGDLLQQQSPSQSYDGDGGGWDEGEDDEDYED